jgi:hypothetical protein
LIRLMSADQEFFELLRVRDSGDLWTRGSIQKARQLFEKSDFDDPLLAFLEKEKSNLRILS